MSKTKTYKLIDEVMFRSISADFNIAVREWKYKGSYIMEDYECACGKKHITEVNLIENQLTGAQLELGSECIKKFLPVEPSAFFQGLRKIKKNASHSIGRKALKFIAKYNWLSNWELQWYWKNARTSRYDSRSIRDYRMKLNSKIIEAQRNI